MAYINGKNIIHRSFNEVDYKNIKILLSKLMNAELDDSICSKRNKESLRDLSYIFEVVEDQKLRNIIVQFCNDGNLINTGKNLFQDLSNIEFGKWDDIKCISVIDFLVRLYNIIYGHLDEKDRFKIIEKRFEKYKSVIDKNSNNLNVLLQNKTNAIEKLCKDIEDDIDEHRKCLSKSMDKLNTMLGDIAISRDGYLKKQDKFESELSDKHSTFLRSIEQQLQDIQDSVYRKELAGYFLNERKSLRGEVNIRSLILCLIVVIGLVISVLFKDVVSTIIKEDVYSNTITMIIVICAVLVIAFCGFDVIGSNGTEGKLSFKWLFTPYWGWLSATLLGMCFIFIVASWLFMNKTDMDYMNILTRRMPLFMSLIWFTWFCSKQFSYTKQICDEYEYKYLLSMSYLGYKNEAKEIGKSDEERALLVTLLDSVIKNVATSPIQCVKSDCHTPFSEVLREMKVSFGKDKLEGN